MSTPKQKEKNIPEQNRHKIQRWTKRSLGKEMVLVKQEAVNNKIFIVLISFCIDICICRYIYIYTHKSLVKWYICKKTK